MTALKWTSVFLIILVALAAAYIAYAVLIANPRVITELQTEPGGTLAKRVMILTLPDGNSIPVNYLLEDNRVYVGADGPWWRQFRSGGRVSMLIQGKTLDGTGKVILDDPQYVEAVFSRLRPAAPKWLPAWLNGKLIVISINSSQSSE